MRPRNAGGAWLLARRHGESGSDQGQELGGHVNASGQERAPGRLSLAQSPFSPQDFGSSASGVYAQGVGGTRLNQALETRQGLLGVRRGEAAINPSIARKILSLFSGLSKPRKGTTEYGLTKREREILQLLVHGLTIRQTANHLGVSFHTVDSHIRNIYSKLHVSSRANAVGKAVQERLV